MTNFDNFWIQAVSFQQVENFFININHAEIPDVVNNRVTFASPIETNETQRQTPIVDEFKDVRAWVNNLGDFNNADERDFDDLGNNNADENDLYNFEDNNTADENDVNNLGYTQ